MGDFMKKLLIALGVTTIIFSMLFLVKTGILSGESICYVNESNLPEKTVYVELMIPQEDIGEDYVSCNTAMCEKNKLSTNAEIVRANVDGYVSYSYHNKVASVKNSIHTCEKKYNKDMDIMLQVIFWYNVEKENMKETQKQMFAYVDKTGNILQLTDKLYLNPFLEKKHININGKDVSAEYLRIKTSVMVLTYFMAIAFETTIYIMMKWERRDGAKTGDSSMSYSQKS